MVLWKLEIHMYKIKKKRERETNTPYSCHIYEQIEPPYTNEKQFTKNF